MTLIMNFFIILILSMMIILINLITFKKMKMDREKNSPFECGFDPISSPRLPFSIQFFLISLMFLIFDIEISILIPSIPNMLLSKYYIISMLLFLMMLIITIYIEWTENNINWSL
uniref:NADH-ubiquinone oxidoreductase chain 3 n=1 Tax=Cerceris bucculata TaxID=2818497 RepID=A0A8B0JV30_9HYME|nr:NADH dehydrogenase subunit 3 [Cerceris bucculata]QTV22609.1 NADH dehydrogenase subunit 3 [Cerceris bucculata]